MPMMKPACVMVLTLPNSMPNIDAAKMSPAEVMTPPVVATVRITPDRIPFGDSSRIREISSML